jgi:hypothetical protein
MDEIVTDDGAPPDEVRKLRSAGVAVTLVRRAT